MEREHVTAAQYGEQKLHYNPLNHFVVECGYQAQAHMVCIKFSKDKTVFVTEFMKTDHNVTRTEIQIMP